MVWQNGDPITVIELSLDESRPRVLHGDDAGMHLARLDAFQAMAGVRDVNLRVDSENSPDTRGSLAWVQSRSDSQTIRMMERIQKNVRDEWIVSRGDSARQDGVGLFDARDLEALLPIIDEKYTEPSAFNVFGRSTNIPVGADTYRERRMGQVGEAAVYRGGDDSIPYADIFARSRVRPMVVLVIGFRWTIFDAQRGEFADLNIPQAKQRSALERMLKTGSRMGWLGASEHDIEGVANHANTLKAATTVVFDEDTNPQAILNVLNQFAGFSVRNSRGVFSPNAVQMTPRIVDLLQTLRIAGTNDSGLLTVLEAFANARGVPPQGRGTYEILPGMPGGAPELTEIGPNGEDGILFWKRRGNNAARLAVSAMPTMIPQQEHGFQVLNHLYMKMGGMIFPHPAEALLLLVPRS